MLALGVLAAAPAAAQTASQEHVGQYSPADIVAGSRLYREQCLTCHGATGTGVGNVDLRRGQFRNASSDEDLKGVISKGVPNTPMPPFKLSDAELDALVAFIRAGLDPTAGAAAKVGDAARGRAVFEKGKCSTCHRVNGQGPVGLAPDLSDVGALRLPLNLQLSILDPSSAMMPVNRPVRIVTKDGRTIRGRRLNEDTYSVQLITEEGRLQSLVKSDITEYEISTTSPMPAYKDKLTAEEVADLVAYLLSLRG